MYVRTVNSEMSTTVANVPSVVLCIVAKVKGRVQYWRSD